MSADAATGTRARRASGAPSARGLPPADAAQTKWWGWGDPRRFARVAPAAQELLRHVLELDGRRRGPVALEDVQLPASRLSDRARARLQGAVGADAVREDRLSRVGHATGKGYPDLLRQREGRCTHAPDAVVWPGSHDHVAALLAACEAERLAVVPFGGGTSVVGGVEPLRGEMEAVVCCDLGRMAAISVPDMTSLTAVAQPGLRGPQAEAALRARGLTLGHFPQSFEYATLGGFAATRSAGQASTGYGRFEDLVLGVRCVTPSGELDLRCLPASAAGPQLRELVVGSEGALGVITQMALELSHAPAKRRYEGWFFRSFAEGADALRRLAQAGAAPDVARLSDEDETRLSAALAGQRGAAARAGPLYLRLRGRAEGCLAITGWEGDRDEVARRRAQGAAIMRRAGAVSLGASPGRSWERSRFAAPYLRDELMERGVLVETLETATRWSDLLALHGAVRRALAGALAAHGTPPLVGCHISHLYNSGASLYFTFLARQAEGGELDQWRSAKQAASDAIAAAGATITHHHAVGRDHVPWMPAEVGAAGIRTLRALKAELDPQGIMNPGKLVP